MESLILLEEIQGPGKTGAGRFFMRMSLLFIPAMTFSFFREREVITPVTTGLFTAFILLLIISFIAGIRMVTQIRNDGIYVRYFPFQPSFSKYAWIDIDDFYIRDYSALQEYGGWGIRFGTMGVKFGDSGKAYIVSGNKGIQLLLKNNAKVLIGTQRPDEMKTIIYQLRSHKA